jgi:hypothetical protein
VLILLDGTGLVPRTLLASINNLSRSSACLRHSLRSNKEDDNR